MAYKISFLNESAFIKKALLNEAMTIEKAQQTFNKIEPEVLKTLIGIDPTYKGGNNVGKLFTWVANSYLKDPSIINDPEKSMSIIETFKNNQNRFTQQVNIKQFETITQLKEFLVQEGIIGGEDNGDELANGIDNALVRQGTKTVHDGEQWLIITPLNYEASHYWGNKLAQWCGDGVNHWCTAASETGDVYNGRTYYEQYLEDEDDCYYMMYNKKYKQRYQFHFNSNQFMDRDDNQIGKEVYNLDGYDELDEFFSREEGDDWAERVAEEDADNGWYPEVTFNNGYAIGVNNDCEYTIIDDNYEKVIDETFNTRPEYNGEYQWVYITTNDGGQAIMDTKGDWVVSPGWKDVGDPYFIDCGNYTKDIFLCTDFERNEYVVKLDDVYYQDEEIGGPYQEITPYDSEVPFFRVYDGEKYNLYDVAEEDEVSEEGFDEIDDECNWSEIICTLNGVEGVFNIEEKEFQPYEEDEDEEDEDMLESTNTRKQLIESITRQVIRNIKRNL